MKTIKLLKYSASVVLFSVITSLAACGSKGGNNAPPPVGPNPVLQNCVNCQNLFQAFSEYFPNPYAQVVAGITLNWTFQSQVGIQQPLQPQQYNPYNPYPTNPYGSGGQVSIGSGYNSVVNYVGPVSASGIISIAQPMTLGYCQIPAGDYQLITMAQGQWSSGIVTNLRLQAVGPATINLVLTQGQVAAKTGSQLGSTWSEIAPIGRIFGNIMFESMNGHQCSQSILVQ